MISPFIRAHGYVPGPTERPILTGTAAGLVAMIAGAGVAFMGGALSEAASRLGIDIASVVLPYALVLTFAGAIYGWLFMRAANDRRGGWLFGMSYGFLTWMFGPAILLQWWTGGPVVVGIPAQFMLASHLLYGLLLGTTFPYISLIVRKQSAARLGDS